MLMLAFLAALATHSTDWDHVIFYCKVADPVSEFSLVFDRRGSVIKDIRIVDRGSPRLSPDDLTSWRGKVDGQVVVFDFYREKKGFWTSGGMRLEPSVDGTGHYLLTWTSTSGGVGGHVPMGSPDESADCTSDAMTQL